jgi:hypothetical protein
MEEPVNLEQVCTNCGPVAATSLVKGLCKSCYQHDYYLQHKDMVQKRTSKWYATNKVRKNAARKKWREAHHAEYVQRMKTEAKSRIRKPKSHAERLIDYNGKLRRTHGKAIDAYRAAHPEMFQVPHDMAVYGPYIEWYYIVLASQNGKCAINGCTATELLGTGRTRRLAVDHNHHTGEVRGLLCTRCNTALGQVGERLARLEGLAVYLRSHPTLA